MDWNGQLFRVFVKWNEQLTRFSCGLKAVKQQLALTLNPNANHKQFKRSETNILRFF